MACQHTTAAWFRSGWEQRVAGRSVRTARSAYCRSNLTDDRTPKKGSSDCGRLGAAQFRPQPLFAVLARRAVAGSSVVWMAVQIVSLSRGARRRAYFQEL